METPTCTGRDPICELIESLLNDLQARGEGSFIRTPKAGSIHLAFGGSQGEAETYDIALVRLASAMMDDAKYNRVVTAALRAPMLQVGG
jgi:hypothetical protein